jgi:hypothetical protein
VERIASPALDARKGAGIRAHRVHRHDLHLVLVKGAAMRKGNTMLRYALILLAVVVIVECTGCAHVRDRLTEVANEWLECAPLNCVGPGLMGLTPPEDKDLGFLVWRLMPSRTKPVAQTQWIEE